MNRIEQKITRNREAYESHPHIRKYISDSAPCVVCMKAEMGSVKQEVPSKANESPRRSVEADVRHFLRRLGIADLERVENREMEATSRSRESPDCVPVYLNFLEVVDLSSQHSYIRKLEVQPFADLFELDVVDETILKFIQRLEAEEFAYDKKGKVCVLNILIFALAYCNRNKLNSKKLRAKIIEVSYLFSPVERRFIDFQDDPVIDRFVLELRPNTQDFNEAIFMNQVYLGTSKSKQNVGLFHKRLVETVRHIQEEHLCSFLKVVFTYRTVLYACADHAQLIRLIISFYQNTNKRDDIVEILSLVLRKADSDEIHAAVFEALKSCTEASKKHLKQYKMLLLRSFRSVSELSGYIRDERESFDALTLVFNDLKCICAFLASDEQRMEALRVVVSFFTNMKGEFLDRFLSGTLTMAVELLSKITTVGSELVSFNLEHWDDLSNMVLQSQRMSISDDPEKKKRMNTTQMRIGKSGVALSECMYKIEELAGEVCGFKRLREKGFQVT